MGKKNRILTVTKATTTTRKKFVTGAGGGTAKKKLGLRPANKKRGKNAATLSSVLGALGRT